MNIDSFPFIMGVAVALGCDAFAVGLALGTRMLNRRAAFRLWFHFGLFQFLMPLIGWTIAHTFLIYVQAIDHWVAFCILALVSINMFRSSLKTKKEGEFLEPKDYTRGWLLVGLSLATSLDALGVGIGMGIVNSTLLLPALCIMIALSIVSFLRWRKSVANNSLHKD